MNYAIVYEKIGKISLNKERGFTDMENKESKTNKTNKTKYDIEYAKKSLKRIPLDVQKEKYEEIKAAADAVGEKVNTYIKKAIDERMERDGGMVQTQNEE